MVDDWKINLFVLLCSGIGNVILSLQRLSMFSLSLESLRRVGLDWLIFSERSLCQSPPVSTLHSGTWGRHIVRTHSQVLSYSPPLSSVEISFDLSPFMEIFDKTQILVTHIASARKQTTG